jgi:uncharacterized protein YmfQ (DUF2313 family)
MTALQYREQLRNLLPPGRALDDGGQGVLTQLLDGMSQEFARVDASAWDLIDESLPDSTVQLLPDWERVCALPDDCTPAGQTISQRQQAVVARFLGNGTPSAPYLTDLAAQLGYTVTIVRRHPFQCGMTCGSPLGGFDWNFVWEVHAALYTVNHFLAGQSHAGDPLASWQNDVLECVMRQHAPAHTIVNFIYT